MNTIIALFRGINVGGHNKLPMKELARVLEGLGLSNIQTYIQSGNVVFDSAAAADEALAARIKAAVNESHGFAPQVMLLAADELAKVIAANPYPEAESAPKSLHVYFLVAEAPDPDWETMAALKKDSERYSLIDKAFYLHAPDGIGRSKLATRVEKALGVAATARNWRTVDAVMTLARGQG